MEQRTRIDFRPFRCAAGHEFLAARKLITRAGEDEPDVLYRSTGLSAWLPISKCPGVDCLLSGAPVHDPRSSHSSATHAAQVPESERLQVWLSPDGERVSVPGYRGAKMPERYRRAGYITFEASSLADFDQIDRTRARQTGNEVYNEVTSYDPAARRARQTVEYSEELTTDY